MSIAVHTLDLCRRAPGRIALPECNDPRVLEAAKILATDGSMSEVWLFGDPAKTIAAAATYGINLPSQNICWTNQELPDMAERTALALTTQAQTRGKTIDTSALAAQSSNALCQAGDLLYEGRVDTALAGSLASTADVIRAAISSVGLARGVRTVSGSFIMDGPQGSRGSTALPAHTYIYADCGVVIDPTPEQLCDIAIESVKTWRCVLSDRGDPVVAFLSFSTMGSAAHPHQEKSARAAALFKEKWPTIASAGELQFDAAYDPEVGRRKAPGSVVPGNANIFIFPDLDSGNLAYKITQRLGGFAAYGPILQGLSRPYSDLSRGATVADIVTSAHINLLRARAQCG